MATNKHIIQIQTKGAGKSKKDIQGISGSLGKMATRAAAAAAVFYAVKGLISGVTELARQAAKVQALTRGFDNLGKQLNFNSQSFKKLDNAVNGTMKRVDLMAAANNAMMLGVVKSDDEMAQLFDTAQRLGQALGVDTANAVNSLVTGMGRQSKLMLDNLGIMVNMEQAYQNYARAIGTTVQQLTDQERKQAFNNEVLAQSSLLVSGLGDEVLDNQASFQQMDTAFNNLAISLGDLFSPAVNKVVNLLISGAKAATDFISGLTDTPLQRTIKELDALGASSEALLRLQNIQLDKQLRVANAEFEKMNVNNLSALDIDEQLKKTSEEKIALIDELSKLTTGNEEELRKQYEKDEENARRRFLNEKMRMEDGNFTRKDFADQEQRRTETLAALRDQLNKDINKEEKEGLEERIETLRGEEEALAEIAVKKAEIISLDLQKVDINSVLAPQQEEELTAKEKWIADTVAQIELQQLQVKWNDELIKQNPELAKNLNLLTDSQRRMRKGMRGMVSDLQVVASQFEKFEKVAKAAAIAQTIFDTYESAQAAFLNFNKSPQALLNPPLYFALGVAAAATATIAGLARVQQIKQAQYGADFVTDGPQMMMVGEGSGPERVQVTPLVDENIEGPQGQPITLNISGNVLHESFIEDNVIPQIREGLRLGENMGI